MKRKLGLIGVLYAAILAAIAGYFFRTAQLSGGSSVPVVAFSVLMVLVFALAAVSLEKYAAYAEVYSPCRQDLAFSLLGAAGLIAGCALDFRGSVFRMLISLLGLLAGFGLGAAAVCGLLCLCRFVLCCQALPGLPPLGDQSRHRRLLLLAVRHDLVHAGQLPRRCVQL